MATIVEIEEPFARYEVHFLNCGNADAIVINYRLESESKWINVVVDAGRNGDAAQVKANLKKNGDSPVVIDYAFCTHPHEDHMGGLIELLQNNTKITNLYVLDPYFGLVGDEDNQKNINIDPADIDELRHQYYSFDKGKDDLILLAIRKGTNIVHTPQGTKMPEIDMMVVGPSISYYEHVMDDIYKDLLTKQKTFSVIEESAKVDMSIGYSVVENMDLNDAIENLNKTEADQQWENKCSMMLLFTPKGSDSKYLFLSDATRDAISEVVDGDPNIKKCIVKIPHHGSAGNLDSSLIQKLQLAGCAITAAGDGEKPNQYLLRILANYTNVYCTSKGTFVYRDSKTNKEQPLSNATPFINKL